MPLLDPPSLTAASGAKFFAPVNRALWDDFSAKPNGAVTGTAMGSSHIWTTTQAGTGSGGMAFNNGKMVAGALPSTGSAAYYALTTFTGGTFGMGASFVYPSGGADTGSNVPAIAVIAWDRVNFTSNANAAIHLAFDLRNMYIQNYTSSTMTNMKTIQFNNPLPFDQELRIEWQHDALAGAVHVLGPDGITRTVYHPLLKVASSVYTQPCWELHNIPSTANSATLPYFTSIWANGASSRMPLRAPAIDKRDVLVTARRNPGSGTSYERPCSLHMQGVTWWDTTLNVLAVGSPSGWLNAVTGTQIGNLVPVIPSLMLDDGSAYAVTNATKIISRSVVAPGRTVSLGVTSAAAGATNIYPNTPINVTGGQAYSGTVKVYVAGTARSAGLQYIWYDASNNNVGVSTGPATSITPGSWTNLAVYGASAPSTANRVFVQVFFNTPAAAGEQFYVSDLCFSSGTITGFIEP